MQKTFYEKIIETSLKGRPLSRSLGQAILTSPKIELLRLLDAAYQIRKKYFGKEVLIHILNNAQNGLCPEDCRYCVQSKSSNAKVATYSLKSEKEILSEAQEAFESGAYRYCIVLSGRKVSGPVVDRLAGMIQKVKSKFPLKTCVSAGFIDASDLRKLRRVGLDRLNHNLNTSKKFYGQICTTHDFADRLEMVDRAHAAGVSVCSGVIIGMGEKGEDILDVALELRRLKIESIPVNFLLPIPGIRLATPKNLTPEFCLRVLCLFRFLNPKAEIRIAAGREEHLRGLEPLALYPANSLFLDGYLNAQGSKRLDTLRMIEELGFTVKSKYSLAELIQKEERRLKVRPLRIATKSLKELRPSF